MGIESDQLVYDFLSRVGDLAQQQQLPSGDRMRLVSTLRGEIDRQRVEGAADSPAAVRRILGRLGAPDELVASAAGSGDGTVPLPSPRAGAGVGDEKPREVPRARRGMLRKDAFRKGASPAPEAPGQEEPEPPAAPAHGGPAPVAPVPGWPSAAAPHMAGLDRAPSGGEPEWWRIEPGPFGEGVRAPVAPGTDVPGFVGGLEIPELFRPPEPAAPPDPDAPGAAKAAGTAKEGEPAPVAAVPAPRRKLRLRRRPVVVEADAARRPRLANPLLLLAAALLVAGAVLGSWLALAGGWLLAYSSRRISRAEAKWVALGLPGVVVAGAFVWLWGRMDGRWGTPIAEGAMGDAMTDVWPVVVRVAAVASALYLVWRARRLPG
ncbi:hypothetical protein ABZ119_08595 [Streptomyces sp. NPDC006288]|uniref:hypothetical protein n=1 Tax=Streptomyces sp. NPDC006288 TaxID=3156743 RepID=UPI00339F9B4A